MPRSLGTTINETLQPVKNRFLLPAAMPSSILKVTVEIGKILGL